MNETAAQTSLVPTAVVLAAGMSRRMGEANKLLLPYGDGTLIGAVITQLQAAKIEDIIVVCGHEAERIRAVVADFPVRVIENPDYERGMTTSIQAGVRAATGAGYMICLGDMPLLDASDYRLLKEAFEQALASDPHCICVPYFQAQRGQPVIFAAAYRDAILTHPDMEGCKGVVQDHAEHVVRVEMPESHILNDIDRPEDYAALRRLHSS